MGTSYYLQHPRGQLFYKILANIATIYSTCYQPWWGYEIPKRFAWFYHFHRWIVRTFGKVVCISQTAFICLYYDKVEPTVLIVALTITPVGFLVGVKAESAKMKSCITVMSNFMDKIHIYNCYLRNKESEYVKTKVIQVERLSRFTANFLTFFLVICWASWMLEPTIFNIRNIDLILNKTEKFHYYIYLWQPFEYEYTLHNFIWLHALCVYLGITAITVIITFDVINFLVVYHLVGHIYILKYNLKMQWSDDFTPAQQKSFLVDTIKYHAFIVRTFEDVQSAFGINVAANYLQNLFEDGLLLYQLMVGDKQNILMYGLMILIYLGGLILMSVVLEEIRRQNQDMSEFIYNIPWEKMPMANQKTVMLLLFRTQPDLEFRAACGMKAGVQPALSIIKSMFSYYVMIKSRM